MPSLSRQYTSENPASQLVLVSVLVLGDFFGLGPLGREKGREKDREKGREKGAILDHC
jgi:hypothetical protein